MKTPPTKSEQDPSGRRAVPPRAVERRVLCVDDDPIALRVLREVLVRAGCRVACAADGVEAGTRHDLQSFDVVITDHDMPRMNGLGLVAHARGADFRGRIIVVSAGVGSAETDAYRSFGVDAIILKPLSVPKLLEVIYCEP